MDRKNYQIIHGVMLSEAKHLAVQQRDSSPLAQNDRYKTFSGLARRFSVSSGEEMTTPASPDINSIKNYKLKIKNYGLFILHFTFYIFNCLFGGGHGSPSGEEFLVARSQYNFPGGRGCPSNILRGKIFVGDVPCPA